jgi:hypothetical protein
MRTALLPKEVDRSLAAVAPTSSSSSSSSSLASSPPSSYVLWLFFLQIFSVGVYVALSYILPNHVPYLTGDNAAIHVAAVHGLLFVVVAGMWVVIRGHDYSRLPPNFPLNRDLAEMNAIITIIANAVLLLCLGVEDWVKQEVDHYDFSVLGVVQVLGVAELAFVTLSGAGCVWRCVAYLRGATPSVAQGGALSAYSGSGGVGGVSGKRSLALLPAPSDTPGATPRPNLPGGTATARLQEVRIPTGGGGAV